MSDEDKVKKNYELMIKNCIFCKIIKKEMESFIVFEDDLVIAVLDIAPISNGHILLMPKEHYMIMQQVPDEVLGHLNVIATLLSDLLEDTLKAISTEIFISNGAAAGQIVNHFLIQIIPRYSNDDLDFKIESDKFLDDEKLQDLASKLKKLLNQSNS